MGSSGREGGAGRRKRKQVILSPVKHISQYFQNIVCHLSESKVNKVIAIESSSQLTLELSTTILSTKLVKPNSPARVPTTTTSGRPPVADQGKEQKASVGKEGKLLHGDSCKTCVRMDKLMGQVLPHSPNY